MAYYYLIASLRELATQGERKGFDAAEIIAEIRAELSRGDAREVNLLYVGIDVENIIAHRQGSERYNPLGTIPKEELDEPTGLPERLQKVIAGYSNTDEDEEEFDRSAKFERALWESWYAECTASRIEFIRRWSEADRVIRSVVAGEKISEEQAELAERVKTILAEHNLVERERRLANLRWESSDTYSEQHYFDITAVLAYLVKVNIIAAQMRLDATLGKELLNKLVEKLKIDE